MYGPWPASRRSTSAAGRRSSSASREEAAARRPGDARADHTVSALKAQVTGPDEGRVALDTYEAGDRAQVGGRARRGEAVGHLRALRDAVRDAGRQAIGSGLHPTAAFGDVVHVDEERYAAIVRMLRGLITRTPTAAVHVHVGMPDAATAILAYNGLRSHLPLLQALAANSPYWYGIDSGFASARAQMFRAYPRSEIARPFRGYADYERTIDKIVAGAEIADYTFLWWDVRPHPRLGPSRSARWTRRPTSTRSPR
jgi:carboxylate-amine ligase